MPEGVELRMRVPEIPVVVAVDPYRLKQVLSNFINNAIKFTTSGYIEVGYYFCTKGDCLHIYVEDTGIGIPEEKQKQVFDRFCKLDEFAQGTGLGLAICQVIAQRFGGEIQLKSEYGKGSRFTLTLPKERIPFVVDQLKSRRQIKDKLPSWYQNDRLVFPAKIAAEQCSSEQTALYKQRLVYPQAHVCDLTGGLGIDSYFFSRKVRQVTYIERFPAYCEAAIHNFKVLDVGNVTVLNGDSTELIDKIDGIDVFYIDPARRGEGNKRVFALQDCEPDLTKLVPVLFGHAPKVIAKLSPMADIHMTLDLLPDVTAIQVLSVKNECKELLFVLERGSKGGSPQICCVNFTSEEEPELFAFSLVEEREAVASIRGEVKRYLYEPNASILKAGAFKAVATRFGLNKLHVSSHLYTSDEVVPSFPGRSFVVDEVIPFTNKQCKTLSRQIPQANITVRNFPLSVDELRKRTKIVDGGTIYLFATTLENGDKVLIKTHKI